MKIQVQQLKMGDVMNGSGETVVGASIGLRTPSGKIDVVLEKNGNMRCATWNKRTEVNVTRVIK